MAAKFDPVCGVVTIAGALVVVATTLSFSGTPVSSIKCRHTDNNDLVVVCQQLH